MLVAEHGHVQRLQPLERRADVEDRLDTRAHNDDAGPRQRVEVGGHVPGLVRAAVHATEPAGGEQADPGAHGQVSRGGDGRCAVAAARGERREVADAALDDVVAGGDHLERLLVEADARRAADDRDGRRQRPLGAHRVLDLVRDVEVARPRQPVADQRALERDHRPAAGERLRDLGGDLHDRRTLPPNSLSGSGRGTA